MNSFYGGKQGNSFIIAKSYTTIAEMLEDFGKNRSSCSVNFDEYVLINTVNKNNPENGQIFRRGYDYNSDREIITYQPTYGDVNPYETVKVKANGAVYIGTIVGPAGRAPIFNFGHYQHTQEKCAILERTFEELGITSTSRQNILKTLNNNYPNGIEILNNGETVKDFYTLKLHSESKALTYYFCFDYKYKTNHQEANGWYSIDSAPATGQDAFRPEVGQGLIPGVTYAYDETGKILYDIDNTGKRSIRKGINELGNTYQDTIDWTYCTVRNENLEDSTVYVGFRFASPVVEFETESVSPYYNRSDIIGQDGQVDKNASLTHRFENLNLIERNQSQDDIANHPFYSLWKIAIPKGIKGECVHNFRCIIADNSVKAFKLDNQGNLSYNEIGEIQVEDYNGKADDIAQQRQIFVFDYICYDRKAEGEHHTIYAGDYNVFKNVSVDEEGTIIMDFTHNDTITYPYLMHWINNVTFEEDGTLTVIFNNEDLNIGQIVKGKIHLPQLIKWITKVQLDEETGKFEIDFNYPEKTDKDGNIIPNTQTHYETDLTWLKYFNVDEEGNITYVYTHDTEASESRIEPNAVKWIKNLSLNENNGQFTVNFNYEEEPDTKEKTQINQFLTWIKDVRLDEDGTVHWDYTTSEDNYQKDNYIKWIKDVKLDADNGDFEVTFNYDTTEKPTKVYESLQWVKDITIAADGTITTDYTNQNNKVQTKFIKWLNSISLNPENGKFIITYNHDTDANGKPTILDTDLTWVKDIHVNADGSVTYTRTTDTVKQTENPLTWITGFTFEDNGDVRVTFNNSSISTIEKNIQWINDIVVNDDGAGNGNQKLSIKYNNKNNYIDIGSPLNYVMRMAVNFANGDLLALYSDPEKRKSGYSYDGISGWTVLGNVKYSKSMTKEAYNNTTAAQRVSDLIAGAVCYRTEVIE